jgi:hypothetical protein
LPKTKYQLLQDGYDIPKLYDIGFLPADLHLLGFSMLDIMQGLSCKDEAKIDAVTASLHTRLAEAHDIFDHPKLVDFLSDPKHISRLSASEGYVDLTSAMSIRDAIDKGFNIADAMEFGYEDADILKAFGLLACYRFHPEWLHDRLPGWVQDQTVPVRDVLTLPLTVVDQYQDQFDSVTFLKALLASKYNQAKLKATDLLSEIPSKYWIKLLQEDLKNPNGLFTDCFSGVMSLLDAYDKDLYAGKDDQTQAQKHDLHQIYRRLWSVYRTSNQHISSQFFIRLLKNGLIMPDELIKRVMQIDDANEFIEYYLQEDNLHALVSTLSRFAESDQVSSSLALNAMRLMAVRVMIEECEQDIYEGQALEVHVKQFLKKHIVIQSGIAIDLSGLYSNVMMHFDDAREVCRAFVFLWLLGIKDADLCEELTKQLEGSDAEKVMHQFEQVVPSHVTTASKLLKDVQVFQQGAAVELARAELAGGELPEGLSQVGQQMALLVKTKKATSSFTSVEEPLLQIKAKEPETVEQPSKQAASSRGLACCRKAAVRLFNASANHDHDGFSPVVVMDEANTVIGSQMPESFGLTGYPETRASKSTDETGSDDSDHSKPLGSATFATQTVNVTVYSDGLRGLRYDLSCSRRSASNPKKLCTSRRRETKARKQAAKRAVLTNAF